METEQKEEETNKKVNENEQFLTDFAEMVNKELVTTRHKKRVKGLRGRKKLFVGALIKKLGIITDTCETIGVDRNTYYYWCNTDPQFKEACKDAQEVLKDLGEKALISLLVERNPMIVWNFNKTKNRDRGYGEHIVTEEVGKKDQKITLEIINTNDSHKDNENLPDERGSSSQQ